MEMPISVTDRLRDLARQPVGASVFFPDTGMAKNPQNSIQPIAIRLGGRKWIKTRRSEGGYVVWKRGEPERDF